MPKKYSKHLIKKRFLETFKNYRRKAWKPVTKKGDKDLFASKFSGKPYLTKEENWPTCPCCNKYMQLFLQLNLRELPKEFQIEYEMREGLLQVFYCTTFQNGKYECDWANSQPFSKCNFIRIIIPNEYRSEYKEPPLEVFPPRTILSWEEIIDMPNGELDDEISEHFSEEEEDILYEDDLNYPDDKLSGWPFWIGGDVNYPECAKCGQPMRNIFQFGCQKNLPHTFGDLGCGWVFQCKNHTDILTFTWQCF